MEKNCTTFIPSFEWLEGAGITTSLPTEYSPVVPIR